MEYVLSRPPATPPIFLYVVDTCLEDSELKALRDSLIVSLSLLPPTALVGLITFGTMANVHEIGFQECPKSYVFRGNKEYNPKQIGEMLGLTQSSGKPVGPSPVRTSQASMGGVPGQGAARFLQPVGECEFTLTTVLEQLQRDPWPVTSDKRPLRCTGVALSVAIGLLEATYQNTGARIMLFTGGPATEGPGMVVSPELKEPLRSHSDMEKDITKHMKKAVKFYDGLAKRVAEKGHVVDIFVGCLDQVGVHEMKSLVSMTNGYMVLSDLFSMSIFQQSFLRVFEKTQEGFLNMAFNATMEVMTTKELRVCGLIGPAVSANKKSASVGETVCPFYFLIGLGYWYFWHLRLEILWLESKNNCRSLL
jgi:protein transport protein SEC23